MMPCGQSRKGGALRARRLSALIISLALLAGCSSSPNSNTYVSPGGATEKIVEAVTYPLDKTVYWMAWAAVAYLVIDPLAPNWEIQEARFPQNHVHFMMTMKRYYAGGAGEARLIFQRRAKELMRAGGFSSYEIVEYSEGMESSVLGAQRTVEGVVRFTKAPA
jgi:hypothetical protein